MKLIDEMTVEELRAEVRESRARSDRQRTAAAERQRRHRARHSDRISAITVTENGCHSDGNQGPLLITLGTRLKAPRCDFSIAQEQQPAPGSGPLVLELISTMNRTLGQIYTDYKPVRGDNRSSLATAMDFEAASIDPAWAAAELRKMCVQFNRGKHGKGNLPGTLSYFRRGLLGAWDRQKAGEQLHLPLVSIEAPIVPQRVSQPAPEVFPTPIPERDRSKDQPLASFDWRSLVPKPETARRSA